MMNSPHKRISMYTSTNAVETTPDRLSWPSKALIARNATLPHSARADVSASESQDRVRQGQCSCAQVAPLPRNAMIKKRRDTVAGLLVATVTLTRHLIQERAGTQ